MSSKAQDEAARVAAPIAAADATALTGVARYTISGSAQNAAVPASLLGKWVTLYCTADVQFAFSVTGSAATLSLNATGNLGTGGATIGKTLVAGQDRDFRVPYNASHLCWIGTSGFLEIYCSVSP